MNSDGWPSINLGDILSIKHGWPFKSEFFSLERHRKPIVVNIGNFQYSGGFRFETTQVKEYLGTYPKGFELKADDILLVMTCQTEGGEILGIPGKVPDDGKIYLHNQRIGKVVIKDSEKIDSNFLYWIFLWKKFNQELFASATGTKILHTAPKRIESFRFNLPPLDEQTAIAKVLDALNDKIELNRQMNNTLEQMAQALFKSWFVDFDPVVAKAAGKKPIGMSDEVAALFPDRFEDSEFGPIPEGWRISSVGDELLIKLGGTPSRANKEFWQNGTIAWINSGEINRFRITTPSEMITSEALEKSATKLLPPNTTVIAITGATLGQISILEIEACANQSVVAILENESIPTCYIYLWIKENIESLLSRQTGGAHQHINKNDVNELKIIFPHIPILKAYKCKAVDNFKLISNNEFENINLKVIQDILLPKLISGEIRIKNAEEILSEAV